MQIEETMGVSFPGSVERPLPEDVVVLVDGADVALGVQHAFNARVSGVRDGGSGLVASRCLEIPLVGSDGEISGILCHTSLRSDTRGALLRRQLLDAARPRATPVDEFVASDCLAAIAGTLDPAFRLDITVRTEIALDLWAFNADPVELCFAPLNLCRNSADAMPDGAVIIVAAWNVEPFSAAVWGFVQIIGDDDGECMAKEVLSQASSTYFSTKATGRGTVLGLVSIRHVEGRSGAASMESRRDAGTLARLFLPRVYAALIACSIVSMEIAYTRSSNGCVFHVVRPTAAAPTT
ncbi:twocomponent hybrid sensor and regulator CDS [Bradyrhizobium sp.]|uniref:ATP-binding protein n=1 Tax=Bradyrhizobium sp. TaxID=376 RepID=UPI0007C1C12B|nr:ATP-binding protein [Bradyrhizobium sp.]CUU20884.1 twocomponent hybrid sensor and regulator CDS [Bradyrhizobium sp.]